MDLCNKTGLVIAIVEHCACPVAIVEWVVAAVSARSRFAWRCLGCGTYVFSHIPGGIQEGAESPPLPVAEEGRLSAPQPRPWRAVAKQAWEGHSRQGGRTVSLFAQDRKEKWVLNTRRLVKANRTWGCRASGTPPPTRGCGTRAAEGVGPYMSFRPERSGVEKS